MREPAINAIQTLTEVDAGFQNVEIGTELPDIHLTYRGLRIEALFTRNVLGLSLTTRVPECNILRVGSVAEKAFAYRCIDHVCSTCAGVRALFDPVSGELVLGVESAGFDRQFRADTLIDVALFMLEEGVMAARAYLGLPFTEAVRPSVSQWLGGFHYGEGFNVYPTATDAFAVFMRKKYQAEELSRDATSILLASGPLRFDVRFFGWRFGYMVETATRGFRHAVMDDGRYVRIQERLAQIVREPGNTADSGWNFRDPAGSAVAYFRPDGTFVVGEYGFGNAKTEENGAAFERVATRHLLNMRYMTFLAEEFPEDLYSDEANRPN
ncbi:hypothetical protein [Deinococcus daejeonensis]|nr:hypothetical protein [Deinococcus daejeonensis]